MNISGTLCRPMAKHLDLGIQGEEIAAKYLLSLGYSVRERNVRFQKLELDIIAFDPSEKMMVFVEVKTRRSHSSAYPIHTAITRHKRSCLRRAIAAWSIRHSYEGPGRIDVVSVSGGRIVEHLRDIGSEYV